MGTKDRLMHFLLLAFMWQIISASPSENIQRYDSLDQGIQAPSLHLTRERSRRSKDEVGIYENEFLERLLKEYGNDGVITVSQLTKLVKNIKINSVYSESSPGYTENTTKNTPENQPELTEKSEPIEGTSSLESPGRNDSNCGDSGICRSNKCLSMVEIFEYHSLSPKDTANSSKLQRMSPTILYQLQNPHCKVVKEPENEHRQRPSAAAVWGYGFLCVTFINLCALMGMVFLPLMRRSFYKNMLLFMVALAVGTLTGSGVLFLIPESFEMTTPESPHADYYIWRSLTVVGGIYLFFLVERLLKMIMKKRQNPKEKEEMEDMPMASVPTHSVHLEESMNMSFKPVPEELPSNGCNEKTGHCLLHKDSSSARLMDHTTAVAITDNKDQMRNGHSNQSSPQHHGHSHGVSLGDIRSVAWMVIFGDGLHNFIDGLSIGAAFTGSIMTGISVSLAVICEELPHELGDFAILLNSGMSMKQALGYNFLSACMCYLGLIIGIGVGEATTGAVWIFAVAGGMFLYIALVDMLPEVNHAAEQEEEATGATWSIFFIQNAGILMGLGIMVLLAVFSGKIDLSQLEQ